MKKQSGFTLIELMVVMAIIAILATAGLTAYSNYLKKARDSARVQVARQLMTAVENLANGGPIPTGAELVAHLNTEGFAYTLPTMNPMIARVSGVIDTVLGTAFALPDLDPMSGAGVCLGDSTGGVPLVGCAFGYVYYTDGTYNIVYGIEHPDSKNNFWKMLGAGWATTWGNVVGTNSYIIPANAVDPANVSNYDYIFTATSTNKVVDANGATLSDISAYVPTM